MKYVMFPNEVTSRHEAGGKALALAQVAHTGLLVPPWFVVTPKAFEACLDQAGQNALHTADHQTLQTMLDQLALSTTVHKPIDQALEQLGECNFFAVRSSAADEDGDRHSFAGQLESYLYVPADQVPAKIIEVWRSGFSERLLHYRQQAGMDAGAQVPAVLVQCMVEADNAGVAFAVDPVSGDKNTTVIGAVYGLGSALVSGDVDADTYYVDRNEGGIRSEIAEKLTAQRWDPNRGELSNMPVAKDQQHQPVLTDDRIYRVADLVKHASEHFQCPQDIEWAFAGEHLYLLQSRAVTRLDTLRPGGELNIWDNSNITESYSGVTTPLTFSFARRAYEEVYRQFCRIMAVPASKIQAHDATFKRMLGLIRGRVYYNLLSWYRVLALLPGFTVNRGFMEQMMGVKEGLPRELLDDIGETGWRDKLVDTWHLLGTLAGLAGNHVLLKRKIADFYQRLNEALALPLEKLTDMDLDELTGYYRGLEQQLLTRWDAPLINDFFAMIFYGVLSKLSQNWCGDQEGNLQNDLLCAQGGMISAEPAKRIYDMAHLVSEQPEWIRRLSEQTLATIEKHIDEHAELKQAYNAYLDKFGDRCLDELKLESETLHDNPLMLWRSVGHLAKRLRNDRHQAGTEPAPQADRSIRATAEARIQNTLARKPVKRRVFAWVLKNARHRVRDRENLRFERTRLFGRVRRVFLTIGERLTQAGALQQPRDVFYLEVDEILGFVEGTSTSIRLQNWVDLRRKEFDVYKRSQPPPDRFETHGPVALQHVLTASSSTVAEPKQSGADHERRGIGCCPGTVKGTVKVITDPAGAELKAGEILVAERTDPGWTMLFPSAAGILVERGSLLSHSAIVAREMGIPAVVSVDGLTRWLQTGDTVEFDGSAGWIRKQQEPLN